MEVINRRLEISDASGVGEARRLGGELSRVAGLSDTDAGRVALVVTEAASNLFKHAGGGELLLRPFGADRAQGIDVLALDRGPGIRDLSGALRDGFSSSGTSGTGLGAIARLASVFDIYSRPGAGTVVFARIAPAQSPDEENGMMVGSLNVPYPGESVSGDCWAVRHSPHRALALVADGLGHGILAAEAAGAAAAAFHKFGAAAPGEVLSRIHEALRPTRGAAVAIAEIDREKQVMRFAGLGNICGTIAVNGSTRSVVSHHGTAGHDMRHIQEFSYPWPARAILVMHSDGLTARWTLENYPGLSERHPQVMAALLYRDNRRGRDDASILVLRERSA
jgi:anti-sigma regulatory factor (Ser/Thr protein kinase)